MNQSKEDEVMNENTMTNDCERAGELVAYFYGETNRAGRESFDAHLSRCGACRDELAAFSEVREAVGQWRAEILHDAPAASSLAALAVAPEAQRESASVADSQRRSALADVQRRSALAALREFFTLTPVWLRAGVAAAALAVCALAALALANAQVRWDGGGLAFGTRLRPVETQTAQAAQASAPGEKVYTRAELDKLVAERDAALRELEDTRAELDDSRAANLISAVATLEPASASGIPTHGNARREQRASPAPSTRSKRRRVERDEEDVPRLYDLLSEAN